MLSRIIFCLFIKALLLFWVMLMPTFGQSLTTYNDSWIDTETNLIDNDPDVIFEPQSEAVSEVLIIGSTVVEIDAKSRYHTLDTQVTHTSPQGRSAMGFGSWHQNSIGTSITVITPLEVDVESEDAGFYNTLVQHFPSCPESHSSLPGGGSTYAVGLSILALERESWTLFPPFARFTQISNCNVRCRNTVRSYNTPRPNEILMPCVHFICAFGSVGGIQVCTRTNFRPIAAVFCACSEISYN